MRVQVNYHYEQVRSVLRSLAVADELVIVYRVKFQCPVVLQGGLFSSDSVYKRDKFAETIRSVPIPDANLVLLRVQVFFTAHSERPVLLKFECRAVDSIVGAKGRGQKKSQGEPGPPVRLQKLCQDVGRIRPVIRPEEIADR